MLKYLLRIVILLLIFLQFFAFPFNVYALDVTFSPSPILLTDAELSNPWRGAYEWNRYTAQPAGWPLTDSYIRYYWNQIETSKDTYNFAELDKQLAHAQAQGGKFGFRIMATNPSCGCITMPQYLIDAMAGDPAAGMSGGNYIPSWNNPYFIERVNAVITALGAKYNNDPRLGFVDMGFYGAWGEWHLYSLPSWSVAMTQANQHSIINTMNTAFSNKFLNVPANDYDYFYYALSLSPRWGWRNDCLANSWFNQNMDNILNKTSVYNPTTTLIDRWKITYNITEFGCDTQDMTLALSQVKKYHAATIGMGNFGSLSSYPVIQQDDFKTMNKISGYRLRLDKVTIPSTINTGVSFPVSSYWLNEGVTPAYYSWNANYQLRNTSGTVVWEAKSFFDPKTFLPTNGTSVIFSDNFSLPDSLAPANYDLFLKVVDLASYYPPMKLAMVGRTNDGAYKLGTITVSGTTVKVGDVNSDGSVDIIDIGIVVDNYGKFPIPNTKADINNDGVVDIVDVGIVIDNYGK